MPKMQIPTFSTAKLRLLMACGYLASDDKDLLKWIEEQPLMVARHRTPEGAYFVRLLLGGRTPDHFHIDLTTAEYFRDSPPEITHKMTDIQKAFARVDGLEVRTFFVGQFAVPTEELPPIIKSTLVQSVEGGVALKMVGGKLSVSGAPIEAIEWGLYTKKDGAWVDLNSKKQQLKISETYLTDAVEMLESAFGAFVVTRRRHAAAKPTAGEKED